MNSLPREARDGLTRAWLKVLSDRHPKVTSVPANHPLTTSAAPTKQLTAYKAELPRSAWHHGGHEGIPFVAAIFLWS